MKWPGLLGVALLLSPAVAQVSIATWDGPTHFGSRVAALGDLNGDGTPDVAASSLDDPSYGGTGSVSIVSGADGSVLLYFGTSEAESYGYALDAAGDVNLDGVPDVVLGAHESSFTGLQSGHAEVRSGVDGSLLLHWDGVGAHQFLGIAVAGVGDADGDGHSDVLVHSKLASAFGQSKGRLELFSGADGHRLFIDQGQAMNEDVGTSPAGLGDVNGDGWPDFAYARGASLAAAGLAPAKVRIVSGATLATLSELPDWTCVAAAGDVDGDGHADAFLGFSGVMPEYVGHIALRSTAAGQILMLALGVPHADPVFAAGDLDLDGLPEAVLSDGDVHSGATGALLCKLDWGSDFAAPGDMDHDGQPDLLRGNTGMIKVFAYKSPTLIDLLPHQVVVAELAGTMMSLKGDDLSLVAHVTLDGVDVPFSSAGAKVINFALGEPAATGQLAVSVSNATGTLVAGPLFVQLEPTHPPQIKVAGLAQTGDTLAWLLFGEPSATGVVLASVNPATVTVGGWPVLWPSFALGVVPLDALGRGQFSFVLPAAAAGIVLQSQLVTLDGGLVGSSNLATTLIPF